MVEESITSNTYIPISIDTPLSTSCVGHSALTERNTALLLGKIIHRNSELFIWLYKSFRGNWYIGGSEVHDPSVITNAVQIHVLDNGTLAHSNYLCMEREYIKQINRIFMEIKLKEKKAE